MHKRRDLYDCQKGKVIGFLEKSGSICETDNFVTFFRAVALKVYRAWKNGTIKHQQHGKYSAPRGLEERGKRPLHTRV